MVWVVCEFVAEVDALVALDADETGTRFAKVVSFNIAASSSIEPVPVVGQLVHREVLYIHVSEGYASINIGRYFALIA